MMITPEWMMSFCQASAAGPCILLITSMSGLSHSCTNDHCFLFKEQTENLLLAGLDWGQTKVAFCYNQHLLSQGDLNFSSFISFVWLNFTSGENTENGCVCGLFPVMTDDAPALTLPKSPISAKNFLRLNPSSTLTLLSLCWVCVLCSRTAY